jgi:hypothetical protein
MTALARESPMIDDRDDREEWRSVGSPPERRMGRPREQRPDRVSRMGADSPKSLTCARSARKMAGGRSHVRRADLGLRSAGSDRAVTPPTAKLGETLDVV